MVSGVTRWHVAFYGRAPRMWRWLIADGRRHCCAFGWVPALGAWVWIDPALEGLSFHVISRDVLVRKLEALSRLRGTVFLRGPDVDVRMRLRGRRRGFWRAAPWCVAVVAALVGSHSRALRPGALCRDLMRDGWEFAFQSEPLNDYGICDARGGGDVERCDGVVAGA